MSLPTLLEIVNLKKTFVGRSGSFLRPKKADVYPVNNVSFSIKKGQILGIIRESGWGKTSTVRMIMHLMNESNGKKIFNGTNLSGLSDEKTTKGEVQSVACHCFRDLKMEISERNGALV